MRTYYPKSRATGTCKDCSSTIEKGQPAWWSPKAGWQCTNCNDTGDQPEPNREPPAKQDAPKPNGLPPVRFVQDGERVDIEFDRMLDAAQAASAFGCGTLENVEGLDGSIRRHERKEFFSRRTVPGLIRMIHDGNPAMTELVERLREEIASDVAMPTEQRRKIRRGREDGDEIDVDRYLGRIPEMWSRMESESVPSKRVTIEINASVSCGQKQDDLGYRAAAAIALADRLTELGASVEIRLMICTTGNPTDKIREYVASVVVKHSDQPMSIPDLATACCDIGAVRLSMIYGTMRYLPGEAKPGLGSPRSVPEDRRVGEFLADVNITSRAGAVRWVQESINSFSQSGVSHG